MVEFKNAVHEEFIDKTVVADHDPVYRPQHYVKNGVECVDWIEQCLTPEEFRGYLKGCSLKYIWRHMDKGKPIQDLEKSGWYINKLASKLEG